MNPWPILISLLVAVGVIAVVRRAVLPGGGARRAPHPLLRPVEALDQRPAWCAVEERETLHVHLRLGGAVCMDCRRPADEGGGGL